MYRGQAEKWIYPKIGATKLKDFKVADADRFFRDIANVLGKASLVEIKSTLRRSIRRAQKHDLIGRNVAELVDLPQGQPGRPSRAMTEEQASKVLHAASGQATAYVKVVKISKGRYGATHAATETGELACGTKPRKDAQVTETSTELQETTCRSCRAQLGLDAELTSAAGSKRCSCSRITLGLRPGELRKLTWDHVDLDKASSTCGARRAETATPRRRSPSARSSCPSAPSRRSRQHRKRQAAERLKAGAAWHDTNLVFCHEDGRMYSR